MADQVDRLARQMYSAALVVDGFSEHTADAMSARQVPDRYYAAAEHMVADLGIENEKRVEGGA